MMKCTNCGAEMAEKEKFCTSCGTPVARARLCANCGSELASGEAFCTQCGSRWESGGTTPALAPADNPPPAKTAGFESRMPKDEAAASDVEFKGVRARFAAALIDGLLYILFVAFVASRLGSGSSSPSDGGFGFSFSLDGWPAVVSYALWFLYFLLMEGFLGGTVGKLLLGIRVVNGRGATPGLVPALLRNLLRIVDFLPLFYLLGIVLVNSSREKQRLGDRLAGTFVVSRRGAASMRAAGVEMRGAGGVLLIVAVLLLLLAGGGYYLVSSGNPSEKLGGLISAMPGQQASPTTAPAKPASPATAAAAAAKPTAPPAATSATSGALSVADLAGAWDGSMSIVNAMTQGMTAQDAQAVQKEFQTIKGQPVPVAITFQPAGADSGSLVMESAGDKAPPMNYRFQNGVLTFDFVQGGAKLVFEGKPVRKGSGWAIDGTFKGSGPERSGTLTLDGTWSVAKIK